MRFSAVVLIWLAGWFGLVAAAQAESARERAKIIVPEGWERAYEQYGYAPAVVIDGIIYVSGVTFGLDGEGTYEEQYARGFEAALRRIDGILAEAGAGLADVVKITSFHTDLEKQGATALKVRMKVMSLPHPAWTAVGTPRLFSSQAVTEIEVIAHLPTK